ncbi:MAG: ribosome biogenesis factor YjgA [Nitrospirota bacterium]|nr:ribosome biogenesis factor YjgA [Nitrospirota bacterium]
MDQISKTQKKKEALSLQALGEQLVKLPKEQIEDIDLPAEIHEAVMFAKTLKKHGALRRQLQYIGTLMRRCDTEPIREALSQLEQGNYKKALEFREIERWRDELIAGNKALIEDILTGYPAADRQKLTQLIRNAEKEQLNNKPPRASRLLFRYLKEIRSG